MVQKMKKNVETLLRIVSGVPAFLAILIIASLNIFFNQELGEEIDG
jgi:hypothetical protein